MRKLLVGAVAVAVAVATLSLTVPAVARAAPRSLSYSYYCKASSGNGNSDQGALECSSSQSSLLNPTGPTFQPQPEPTIYTYVIEISYDPAAGTLTFTQTEPDSADPYDPNADCNDPEEANPDECDQDGMQAASVWADTGRWSLSDGEYTPGPVTSTTLAFGNDDASDGYSEWSSSTTQVGYSNGMGLTESGVRGTLQPVVTVSGNAITFVWTSSLLKGLNMTKVESASPGFPFLDVTFDPSYFPGDQPVLPLPNLPVGTKTPQFKPRIFESITGDGSAVVGGPTGHTFVPRRLNDIGKLDWTSWTHTSATATGIEWSIYGGGCNACSHTWQDSGKVTLHAYDPVDGVFSRMTVIYGPQIFRVPHRKPYRARGEKQLLKAEIEDGYYGWDI